MQLVRDTHYVRPIILHILHKLISPVVMQADIRLVATRYAYICPVASDVSWLIQLNRMIICCIGLYAFVVNFTSGNILHNT